MKKFLLSLILCALIFPAALIGCQGSATQSIDSDVAIKLSDGTEVTRSSKSQGKVVTPPNAKEPATLTTTETGVSGSVSGNWETKAVDYAKKNYYIFYIASLVFIVAGGYFILYSPMYKAGGFWLAGVGVACAFAPSVIDTIGIQVAYIIGGLLIVAVVYLISKYVFHKDLKDRAIPATVKLEAEGKPEAALAIKRAISPELDDAYKKVSKSKVIS